MVVVGVGVGVEPPPPDVPHVADGVVLLPFFMMVTPNVLEPVEVTVRPLTLAFQLFWMVWLPLRLRVAVQELAPLTV